AELVHERRRRLAAQLLGVALRELLPARLVVPEPAAELVARRDLLHPAVDLERLLAHAPRPEPVHEHPVAVAGRRLLVRPLHPHRAGRAAPARRPCPAPRARSFRVHRDALAESFVLPHVFRNRAAHTSISRRSPSPSPTPP